MGYPQEKTVIYIRYMGSFIYDGIVVLALFFLFTALCLYSRHGIIIPTGSIWYQLALTFIFIMYYFLSYQKGGQTIGMRAWRLKLISLDTPLSGKQILARFILKIPAFIFSVLYIQRSRNWLEQWTRCKVVVVL